MQNALLITDGDCGFCQRSANVLARNFPGDWINLPSQSINLADYGLTKSEADAQVWFMVPTADGFTKFGGAQAVGKLLLTQRKFYIKPLAALAFVPITSQIAKWMYRWIARNRHLFSAPTESCSRG